jgi:hypothetical protein
MVMRRRSGLSLVQQAFALRASFPEAKTKLNATRLLWMSVLQPTALSRSYRVQITYVLRQYPSVRVLDELAGRDGASLPHVYSNGTLCLHQVNEWTSNLSLVNSTVPWAAEWLANYEIWLATGDWYGGGEWPPGRATPTSEAGSVGGPTAGGAKAAPSGAADVDEPVRPDQRGWPDDKRRRH